MFLIRNYLKPTFGNKSNCTAKVHIRQVRTTQGSVRVSKEKFQLILDVRQFTKDEITVKAHPDYVIIEGKQEKRVSDGNIVKQFVRKYRLPEGCEIKKMESSLSPEGILTISAPRQCSLPDAGKIIVIPIKPEFKTSEDMQNNQEVLKKYLNPCADYPKVKPKN